MAPATHARLTEPKPIGQPAVIALDRLVPSPANRGDKDTDLAGLAASIAAVGLLYPLIVRPHPELPDSFQIVAGERRFRALRRLKAESAPCVIIGEDGEAPNPEILRVVENHQRKNLSPLEEAAAIRALLDSGLDLQTVARSLGRSRAFLARRSSLADLSEGWVRQVKDPESRISLWPPAHLELVARFPTETQEEILARWQYAWSKDVPGLAEIKDATCNYLQLLSGAPWALDDDTLCPEAGSCAACPKRSGHAPELFPEELPHDGKAPVDDHCLDSLCWKRKTRAHLKQRIELTLKHYPKLVLLSSGDRQTQAALREEFGLEVYAAWEVAACGSKRHADCKPALIADGASLGRFKWVLPAEENGSGARVHRHQGNGASQAAADKTPEEKKAPYDKRRRQFVIDAVKAKLEALAAKDEPAKLLDFEGGSALVAHGFLARTLCLLAALLNEYGWRSNVQLDSFALPEEPAWTNLFRLENHELGGGKTRASLLRLTWRLLRLTLHTLNSRLLVPPGERDNARHYAEAETICVLLGLDLSCLREEAAQAIPYAKCWRDEVEDEWSCQTPAPAENENQPEDDGQTGHAPTED